MAVNFGLLQPAAPVSAFFQGQQDVRQQAEQNMLREMQAEKMQYERENALAQREQRLASAAERQAQAEAARQRQQFLTGLGAKMAEGGYKLDRPTLGQMLQFGMQAREDSLIKLATEGLKALDEEDLYQREAAKYGIPTGAAQATSDTGAAPANGLAAPQGVTREQVQNMLRSPVARIREMGKSLVSTLEKPERAYEPTEVEKLTMALRNAPPGSPEAKALNDRIRILTTREPKEPREPREPSAPIAVVDDATGKIKYVPREEAIGKTPASALEGLAPKEIQKREAAFPQSTAAIKGVEANADAFIKDLKTLRDHPGLDGITGLIYGRTASAKGTSRQAQALYDKIVAKGGFQMLQAMREASKTGGALGNVSNEEGRRLQAAFAAIDRKQDAADVRTAIDTAISEIEGAKARTREAYESTYEYKQRGGAGAAAATDVSAERANAKAAIAAGAPEAAVRKRFKEKTGQEL